jgi:hypothetical protein
LKSFSDTAFFRVFEDVLRRDRPKDSPGHWSAQGVDWYYSRHNFEAPDYGFTMEVYEAVNRSAKGPWSFIVIKEHWWAGRHGNNIRSTQWAKPLRGDRAAIWAWFKQRERVNEGKL